MLYQVGQTVGACITAQRQKVVHRVVAGRHRVQQRVAVVPQPVAQNERRSRQPNDSGRGHLGVQFGAIRDADGGRDGGGERGTVRVQQFVPARPTRSLRSGRVQKQWQVQRGRPVMHIEEVHDERVERKLALVVLEHHG